MIINYNNLSFKMSSLKKNLIKDPPTHPRDVRLDLPKSQIQSNTMNNALPAYWKPKKYRWWKNTILICCCISAGSATLAILAMLRLIG